MKVVKKKVKASKIKGNPDNPRVIKDHKFELLTKSIQDFSEMMEIRPIVVDENMMILGGNMRFRASQHLGIKDLHVEIVEGLTDKQKKEFTIKDNASFGMWEWDILANEWDSVKLEEWGIDVWQNMDDVAEDEEEMLSKNIKAPEYEPKNEKPKENDLFNEEKTKKLVEKINLSKITKAEKEFLIKAAYRHTVFNYQKIADFYAHSNKDVQKLMEESALVVIDLGDAIRNGFVTLTEKIQELYKDDYE